MAERPLSAVLATKSDRLMTSSTRSIPRLAGRFTLLLAAFVAVLAFGQPVLAAGEEPGAVTRVLGLRTQVPDAPDFVSRTRPKTYEYVPVGGARNAPKGKVLTADEIRAQEKALDSALVRQDRIAGRKSAPKAERSVADGGQQKKKAAAEQACGLTCANPALRPTRPGKQ